LGHQPRYTSLQAVREAVAWLIDNEGLLADERMDAAGKRR
jgi:hypothetical protein